MKIDKQQRIHSYTSGAGLMVYEIEQYNKDCDTWFIVGDSSTLLAWIQHQIKDHNKELIK